MPVAPLTNTTPAQPAPAAQNPAAPGFADALANQLRGGGGAPAPDATVSLGQMIALRAQMAPESQAALLMGAPVAPPAPLTATAASAPSPPGTGNRIIDAAKKYLGVPYKWGGTNPATGLDCSGFTQRVFSDLGVKIPRVSKDQSRAGQPVGSLAQARPGDLVYWNGKGGRPNHIGIYLGDGQMMHAPRTGDVVKVAPVRSAPPDAIRRVM